MRGLLAVGVVGVAFGCTTEERRFGSLPDTRDASADAAAPSANRDGSGDAATDAATTNDSTEGRTTEGGTGSTTGATSSGGATDASGTSDGTRSETKDPSGDGDTSDTTSEATSTSGSSTGDDFGVGEPPDYGDLGSGEGRILVVNALDAVSVDVWLAGSEDPIAQRLPTETATRVDVSGGARRVVLTRQGTRDVVGCSEWFPLRSSEQWAVVPRGGEHTCAGSGDGSTLSFRQGQSLDTNPIRYVHATTPDTFSFTRNQQSEAGSLEVGETLSGTSLPSCSSGCTVDYELAAGGVAARHFSLTVRTVEELPPAGEVMLLVLGNVRQDWPAEPDALRLLRVDLDGTTYVLRRDPELAFGRIGDGVATFSTSTPPSFTEVALVDPYCNDARCPLEGRRWRTGTRTFLVEAPEGNAEITVELEAGHRYVLLSTPDSSNPLYWLDADFDRSQADESYVRAINLDEDGEPLSFGYVFGDSAVAIDTLASVPWGEVSAGNGGWVPAEESWRLVTARDVDALGIGCFYSMDTAPGYRGYFVAAEMMQPLDITHWPPSLGVDFMVCF